MFNGVGAASSYPVDVFAGSTTAILQVAGGSFFSTYNNPSANAYYVGFVNNGPGSVGGSTTVPGGTATGLVSFALDNGTQGWLHVTTMQGQLSNAFVADYFVFDGADDQTRPPHLGNSEAFDGFGSTVTTTRNSSVVPEPSSLALLALGAAGVMGRRRRQTA